MDVKNFDSTVDKLYHAGAVGGFMETCIRQIYRTWILKPGYVALDIGAHVGLHTFPMAEAVGQSGKVIAFEANPVLASALREKAKLYPQILVENLAVSGTAKKNCPFYVNDEHLGQSTLVANYGNNFTAENTVHVDVVTIDSYLPELSKRALAFIKIDAEGAELDILSGAELILDIKSPLIAAEVSLFHYRKYASRFTALLERINYGAYLLSGAAITDELLDSSYSTHAYTIILAKNDHWTSDFCRNPEKMQKIVLGVAERFTVGANRH